MLSLIYTLYNSLWHMLILLSWSYGWDSMFNGSSPRWLATPSRLTHDGNSNSSCFTLCSFCTDRMENTASNNSSVVAWLFITVETCLPCRCLTMNILSGSAIPAFIRHVTVLSLCFVVSATCSWSPRVSWSIWFWVVPLVRVEHLFPHLRWGRLISTATL
jgi:hypothetical protein